MDASIRIHMLEFFEGCKEEFGLIDSTELIKLCPTISLQEDQKSIAEPNTENPIFHGEQIIKSNNTIMNQPTSDSKVDLELLTYIRTIFLQVNYFIKSCPLLFIHW